MFDSYYMVHTGHIYPNQMNQDDRRVAVIDYEDAEQVERLLLARWRASGFDTAESGPSSRVIDEWQVALREFADPKPRIEEPRGLGAVVEASNGDKWSRIEAGGNPGRDRVWVCEADETTRPREWSSFNVVRVLSEGVTS